MSHKASPLSISSPRTLPTQRSLLTAPLGASSTSQKSEPKAQPRGAIGSARRPLRAQCSVSKHSAAGRIGAAISRGIADSDLGVAGAGIVFLLRACASRQHEGCPAQAHRRQELASGLIHRLLPDPNGWFATPLARWPIRAVRIEASAALGVPRIGTLVGRYALAVERRRRPTADRQSRSFWNSSI